MSDNLNTVFEDNFKNVFNKFATNDHIKFQDMFSFFEDIAKIFNEQYKKQDSATNSAE